MKNPAVPADSPYLAAAARVETDISLFLRFACSPIIAVTGTKGKSTVASAIHFVLVGPHPKARLGGNIMDSPLRFIDDLAGDSTPVVLELSSWQLADVAGLGLLDPQVSVVLNIMKDHQNRYRCMEEYVADKRLICSEQSDSHTAVLSYDDPVVRAFAEATRASVLYVSRGKLPHGIAGAWLDGDIGRDNTDGERLFSADRLKIPGRHNRFNMLAAATALGAFGVEKSTIAARLAEFPGIRHRLEFVAEKRGVRYVNDTTATIPEATVAATHSFQEPVHLIAGGTDKNLDYRALVDLRAESVHLLRGSGTRLMEEVLTSAGIEFAGPFSTLEKACASARSRAAPGSIVLFSPGCTSFEMFDNEIDRGERFRRLVQRLPD